MLGCLNQFDQDITMTSQWSAMTAKRLTFQFVQVSKQVPTFAHCDPGTILSYNFISISIPRNLKWVSPLAFAINANIVILRSHVYYFHIFVILDMDLGINPL